MEQYDGEWFFEADGPIALVAGDRRIAILDISPSEYEGKVKVQADEVIELVLKKFKWTKNELCKKLKPMLTSRTGFVKLFKLLQAKTNRKLREAEALEENASEISASCSGDSQVDEITTEENSTCESSTTGKNGAKLKSKKTAYMSDLKIIANAVEVHIANLVEPNLSRLVREVDQAHVQALKEEYRRTSTSFGVLAGVVWGDIQVNSLKEPNAEKIEVIGGNHLRAALQELYAEGSLLKETLLVKLYSGLTDEECLQVGYYHNDVITKSKQMTFMEVAGLMRRKLAEPGKKRALKKALSLILGFDDVGKMNDNKKTHLKIATTTDEVFALAKEADELASQGKISGIKAGHLMQSRFSILFGKGLTDEMRVQALKKLIDDGTNGYRKILKEYSDSIKNVEKSMDTGDVESKEEESSSKDKDETEDSMVEEAEDVVIADPSEEMTNLEELTRPTTEERELEDLKLKYQALVNENLELHYKVHSLERENMSLKEQLEERNASENGKSDFMSSLMLGEPRDNPGINSNASADRPLTKKQKTVTGQKNKAAEFDSGEVINSKYSGNGLWYEAIIVKKMSGGTYLVEYTSDGIQEKRTKKDLKKKLG